MKTIIVPKKNLYNHGLCFSKGKEYIIDRNIKIEAGLMGVSAINNLGEPHIIGSWWRSFNITGYINS